MWKFWSLNYICQDCKIYFYLPHVRNFRQYLDLSVFSKHWKFPFLSFVQYMLCSHFTQNSIFFWYFLEAKNPCFVTKVFWKCSCLCVFMLWLVAQISRTPRWISFLILYWLICITRSHSNEPIWHELLGILSN